MSDAAASLDPNSLFFENNWVLRGHFESDIHYYKISYIHLLDVSTIADWCTMINHIDVQILMSERQQYMVHDKPIAALSLFKHPVLPEWEDKSNHNGYTLSFRGTMEPSKISLVWRDLTCDLVREGLEDYFLGIQMSKKWFRRTLTCKIDVWLSSTANLAHAHSLLRGITELQFTNVPRHM